MTALWLAPNDPMLSGEHPGLKLVGADPHEDDDQWS